MSAGVETTAESTEDAILERISEIIVESWKRRKTPALLSYVGSVLSKETVDYRASFGGRSLHQIIAAHPSRFSIVQHPDQPLTVGAIPFGETFSYEKNDASNSPVTSDSAADKLKQSRGALYSFIRELSKLSKEEADRVIIPTSILIRLLEGK